MEKIKDLIVNDELWNTLTFEILEMIEKEFGEFTDVDMDNDENGNPMIVLTRKIDIENYI